MTGLGMLESVGARSIHHPSMSYNDFNAALVVAGLKFFNALRWQVLSIDESVLAQAILRYHGHRPLYHGGGAGIKDGEQLLPSKLTGLDPRSSGQLLADRVGFVHVTSDIHTARHYANSVPSRGDVYHVQPTNLVVNPIHMRMAQAVAHRSDIPNAAVLNSGGLAAWIYHTLPSFLCQRAWVIGRVRDK